ncbi:MAG: CpsD/CapB family tyrosine-protein kinase [Lachnospiraceae bacterium]|nr:CpsD/CapB family tyrosine-protein kinase [Lachnospiraceae bacterium]
MIWRLLVTGMERMDMGRKSKRKMERQKAKEEKMVLSESSSFLMKEDYAALRTNVAFSLPGEGGKCIVVTSSIQHEGKSTTALNLAASYAQVGKKVLLIDCDMRMPVIASRLHIKEDEEKKTGLSHLLIGECKESDAVRYVEKLDIYMITAGMIPADPTRLLSSSEMTILLDKMKKEYDVVVLDCPPVNIVVDACLLAGCVDGYLLVVQHGKSEKRAIASMISQIKRVNGNILGFVYTNAPVEDKKYGGYQYGYGRK